VELFGRSDSEILQRGLKYEKTENILTHATSFCFIRSFLSRSTKESGLSQKDKKEENKQVIVCFWVLLYLQASSAFSSFFFPLASFFLRKAARQAGGGFYVYMWT